MSKVSNYYMEEKMPSVPVVGHNNPPTPFEDAETTINDLYGEAKHWLDGEAIDSEDLAEGVTDLLNQLREAGKEAEALRKEEKKPHDDAGKAVQAKYKPLSDMVGLATDAAKKALQPWLVKKAEEKAVEDARLKAEADAAEQRERELRMAAQQDDLASQEALRAAEEESSKAAAIATKSANASGGIKVGGARAVGLRTTYKTEITDPIEAVRYYWKQRRPAIADFLLDMAKQDVHAGKREIPGFIITQEKKV